MPTTTTPGGLVLTDGPAHVTVAWEGAEQASMSVLADPGRRGAHAAASLACRALSTLRHLRRRHVVTALDASTPAAGIVLSALHARVGAEVESLETHRAGSSVIVTIDLRPPTAA